MKLYIRIFTQFIEIVENYKFYEIHYYIMEKTERKKYYPINLKDKKLHSEFMIFERTNEYKNVDDALRCLLDDSNALEYGKETIEFLKTELLEAKKKIRELEEQLNYCRDERDRNEMELE